MNTRTFIYLVIVHIDSCLTIHAANRVNIPTPSSSTT